MTFRDAERHIDQNPIGYNEISFRTDNVTPSWKRFGDGSEEIGFRTVVNHPEGGTHISITASETSWAIEPGKRDVVKEVSITLCDEQAHALYEYLKEKFEGAA